MSDAVVVRSLSVRLGDVWAVVDVDFALPEASVLAVVGPNGSGKSTLVRALLGLVQPQRGEVRVLGRPAQAVPARDVGYVPQIKALDRSFPGRSVELVASGILQRWPWRLTPAQRRAARAALRAVEAEHLADRAISALSGGELQRAYLARAVARDPRLVILDEPATGMDVVGEETIYRYVDRCRRRGTATVVMVTHDIRVASHHATHVLLLSRRQLAFGAPRDVLSEESLGRVYGHAVRGAAGPPAPGQGGTP